MSTFFFKTSLLKERTNKLFNSINRKAVESLESKLKLEQQPSTTRRILKSLPRCSFSSASVRFNGEAFELACL